MKRRELMALAAAGLGGFAPDAAAKQLTSSELELSELSLPGDSTLSQGAFETMLVDALRRMDPARAVWIDETLLLGDALALPAPLRDALRHAPALRLDVSLAVRVAALGSHLEAQAVDVVSLIQFLLNVIPAATLPSLDASRLLAAQGRAAEALSAVVADCTDHLYEELAPPEAGDKECSLALATLSEEAVLAGLATLPVPWRDVLDADPDQISP